MNGGKIYTLPTRLHRFKFYDMQCHRIITSIIVWIDGMNICTVTKLIESQLARCASAFMSRQKVCSFIFRAPSLPFSASLTHSSNLINHITHLPTRYSHTAFITKVSDIRINDMYTAATAAATVSVKGQTNLFLCCSLVVCFPSLHPLRLRICLCCRRNTNIRIFHTHIYTHP